LLLLDLHPTSLAGPSLALPTRPSYLPLMFSAHDLSSPARAPFLILLPLRRLAKKSCRCCSTRSQDIPCGAIDSPFLRPYTPPTRASSPLLFPPLLPPKPRDPLLLLCLSSRSPSLAMTWIRPPLIHCWISSLLYLSRVPLLLLLVPPIGLLTVLAFLACPTQGLPHPNHGVGLATSGLLWPRLS
jgi:hypothetical protein